MKNTDTNSNAEVAENVDAVEDIAGLLIDDEEEQVDDDNQDKNSAGKPTDESTEEVNESDEEEDTESDDDDNDASDASEATWSEVLGIDDSKIVVDEQGDLAGINVQVNGETSTVNLESLVNSYQFAATNTNKAKALAEERKEFEVVRDSTRKEYTQQLEDVSKLTEYLHQTLTKDYSSINWEQLRYDNPAEYAASMQDFNTRNTEIQNIYAAIGQDREKTVLHNSQESEMQSQEYIGEQVKTMVENNPDWADSEKMKAAFEGMSDFVVGTYGFTKEEFNNTVDARLIEVLKDAQKYRKGQKIATNKLVKKVPKFQKQKSRSRKVSKLDKLTSRAKSAVGANKRDAQASAIAELLT